LQALRQIFKIKSVSVWGKDKRLVAKFLKEMRRSGEKMAETMTIKDCVKDADIVVTTTPSRGAIVKSSWIKPGTHINAIGADAAGKQELDPAILKKARVVVDDFRQASHSGEINVAFEKGLLKKKDIYAELGQIISGKKHGRSSRQEITVFDSTGLAIQDLAIADLVYRTALRKKAGRRLNII
jgi:alanine dehydrogenase